MKFSLNTVFLIVFSVAVKAQTLNYYFGNLHSHTGYSDGNKDATTTGVSTPSASYAYAKLSQNFDFLGISEHNHYSSSNNPGMFRSLYAPGLAQATAANTGTFLCLYGMEWGVSSTGNGHVVIYGFNQLIGWETSGVPGNTPNYDIYNDKTDYNGLFTKIKNNPNAFCTLAHPQGNTDYAGLTNGSYNPAYDSAIVGTVFRNGPAFSTDTTYSDYAAGDYFWYYRKMLSLGYHVGINYDQDNHYTTFGRANAGRLVVMTPTLTQTNFYSAMKSMHFYASDDWNTKMDFKINTSIMGDSTSGLTYPTINFVHNDGNGETADSIKIWSGVEGSGIYPTVIKVVRNINTLTHTDNLMTPGTNRYYFIEVVQNDGDRVITSPIWYKLSNFAGVQEYKNDLNFVMFPNPVKSVLSISTPVIGSYKVEIFDVSGKCVFEKEYNSENINISTEKFSEGFYSVKISNPEFTRVQKLVIE